VTRIPIRSKLAGSLAVPLLALVVVGVLEVRQTADEVAAVRRETQLAGAITGPAGIITRLQDERTWASIELVGMTSGYEVPMAGYPETRAATDEAIAAFRAEVESSGGAVESTYRDAIGALDELAAIRRDIDATPPERSVANMPLATAVYDRYSALVQALLDANARVTPQVEDGELRAGTQLANLATQQLELEAGISRTTVVSAMLSPNGIDTSGEIATIATLLNDYDLNNQEIERASGVYDGIVRDRYPAEFSRQLVADVEAAIQDRTIEDLGAWMDGINRPPEVGFAGLRDAVLAQVTDRADELDAWAVTRQRLYGALTVAGVLLAAIVAWLVSRSITRPLRSLTRQAKEMADHRLPEAVLHILDTPLGEDVVVPHVPPVAVPTRDEVADVTEALNTVQESALDLAVEQAVLRRNIADSFVNLGRRNQNLLGRQLAFITQLETGETDAGTLAALFRLDHLATRMRRNAESLLVLAGIEPPRTWLAPVRLTDVVRAALGEVENYQRVHVDVEPVMIVGAVAADLAHLLAELVENALTFSPPGEHVAVRGQRGGPAGFRLLVIDRGFGMSPAALEQANRRLARAESFTVAPSKYLGHYVAGNLAARYGIGIRLEPGSPRGLVASVDLPPHLLTTVRAPEALPAVPLSTPAPAPAPAE
jgi:signal transduction histidine kinase